MTGPVDNRLIPACLRRLKRTARTLEDGLLVLILALMITLAGSQILLRNVLDMSLPWGDPLLRLSVLWVGLLGAMAAARDGSHISIDVLYRLLPAGSKHLGRLLTDLFTATLCAVVAYHASLLVLLEKNAGSTTFGDFPAWLCEIIIPIAFAVMALRFLLSFIMRLVGVADDTGDRQDTDQGR